MSTYYMYIFEIRKKNSINSSENIQGVSLQIYQTRNFLHPCHDLIFYLIRFFDNLGESLYITFVLTVLSYLRK